LPPPGAQNIGWSNPDGSYNSLHIYINGSYSDSLTMFSGPNYTSEDYYLDFNIGDSIDVYFQNNGSAANECFYRIYDPNNYSITVQGFPGSVPGDFSFINFCDSTIVPGCTDTLALNYDQYATIDDGSCIFYTIYGCTDSLANNYNPFATIDDSTCLYSLFIYGCLDSLALNYDSNATNDDGSCCYNSNYFWNQLWSVNGNTSSAFGKSVDINLNGNVIIVGGDHTNNFVGQVKVYEEISGILYQKGQILDGDAVDDRFGCSVSISSNGEIIAVGAWGNSSNGSQSGHVRVFEFISGVWIQIGQDIEGESSFDFSGRSISLSDNGSVLAIGARNNDGSGIDAGHVRIFENVSGNWIQIGQDIDGESAGDSFGHSVSLNSSGNIIAIGGDNNNDNGTKSGHVRIYEYNGSWVQIGQDIDGENAFDRSGCSVSINGTGNIVAIGADNNDGNGGNSGHVRIYENISGTWVQIGQDIDGEAGDDHFGSCVSINSSGDVFASGAFKNDGNGSNAGHVRIFKNISGSWSQLGQDIDGPSADSYSGRPCAINDYGDVVAIGAPWHGNSTNGNFRVFNLNIPCGDLGCLDPLALNFDPYATVDDSTCIYPIYGCTDILALNYNSLANIDDGSCIPIILGCTDSTAINYFSGANIDDGSCIYTGCTDSTAINYNPLATIDDGSCYYGGCQQPAPINLFVDGITDNRATINWDNMNINSCMVLKYVIRYRELGTNFWTTKSGGAGNGLCNFGLNNTSKTLLNLIPGTTYQYKIKAFYCYGGSSVWTLPKLFTTESVCPPMTNLTVQTYTGNTGKATFSWDSTGAYVFARIALRINNPGSSWQTAGGFGVYYPTLLVNKFGLQSGTDYRAQGRTFCDSNITSYRSWWTSPIFWSQPGIIRLHGASEIKDFQVFPNPSRGNFNIVFRSDEIQKIAITVLDVLGEIVYKEDLFEFIGEYTRAINLSKFGKSIYFLEIETKNGKINKKLMLQ
jgi:hypothetical protein